jgi:hypothetical protein
MFFYSYLSAGGSSGHPDQERLLPLRGAVGTDPRGAGTVVVVLLASTSDHVTIRHLEQEAGGNATRFEIKSRLSPDLLVRIRRAETGALRSC